MRRWFLGAALAVGLGGAAQAADFVVVQSSDPAIARGATYESGALIQLAAGQSIVLVDTAGQVTRLVGGPRGAVVPRMQVASMNEERMAVLKMLVAPPRMRRSGPTLPNCPQADLGTIDGIFTVAQVDGCLTTARTAFDAYVEKALKP
ncbi:MAG: hypothetical protein AB1942_12010 [Pseudomonadota bacterium]